MEAVDAGEFKRAASKFATGVTVVTSRRGGEVYGITVSAFASLSLEPLQVLVSIRRGNPLHDMILESGVFAVNILREEQRDVSQYFAISGREPCRDEFPDVPCAADVTGAPIIENCLAYFDCRLAAAHPGGDHTVFIGEVVGVGAEEGSPLLYFNGNYRGIREWETAGA